MMKIKFLLTTLVFYFTCHLQAQQILFKELLSRPTDTSATVQIMFADSAEVSVQYDTLSGSFANQTAWQTYADSVAAPVVLSGLQPNTQYYYRYCYRHPGDTGFTARPQYSFHTQRAPGTAFSFVVEADPHDDSNSDTALYRQCLLNQLKDKPDFMIDLGDFLMTDKLQNTAHVVPYDTIPYRCKIFRDFYSTSGNSVPLYIALGNHEGEAGWYLNGTANNVAVWDAQVRKQYFLNPEPNSFYTGDTTDYAYIGKRQSYYAWQWGDAQFIVLDPFWYTTPKPDSLTCWNWSLGKTQYDWLRATLEHSTAKFKFVFLHQLVGGGVNGQGRGGVEYADLYEWGGNNLDGTPGFAAHRPGWYKPIKDLLTENHVNIFFHGHDHLYDQQVKDCLIYQETPQPSLPNFNNTSAAAYGYVGGDIVNNSGHLRVNVSAEGVQVQYVRVYLPGDTNSLRHNGDISATYFISAASNCYDSAAATGIPVLWNSNYADELVYPNPFMKQTIISFSLSKPDRLTVNIYDRQGQLVRPLVAGSLVNEGQYKIMWDGKSGSGTELASGVYEYVISGETTGISSGKIVLMR